MLSCPAYNAGTSLDIFIVCVAGVQSGGEWIALVRAELVARSDIDESGSLSLLREIALDRTRSAHLKPYILDVSAPDTGLEWGIHRPAAIRRMCPCGHAVTLIPGLFAPTEYVPCFGEISVVVAVASARPKKPNQLVVLAQDKFVYALTCNFFCGEASRAGITLLYVFVSPHQQEEERREHATTGIRAPVRRSVL